MMINPFPHWIKKIGVIAPSHQQRDLGIVSECQRIFELMGINLAIFPSCNFDEDNFKKSHSLYPSASVEVKVADIHTSWSSDSVDLILPLMGGGSLAGILPYINWDCLRTKQKSVLGYSDISTLHLAMLAMGVGVPIVSPNAFGLAKAIERGDALTCASLRHSLECQISSDGSGMALDAEKWNIRVLKPGVVNAPAVAATLSVLAELIGTDYLPDLSEKILIVEQPKMSDQTLIEKILIQLRNANILEKCAGLVLGDFEGNGHSEWRRRLFEKYAQFVPGPVLASFPFGHNIDRSMVCLRQGAGVSIEDNHVIFNQFVPN